MKNEGGKTEAKLQDKLDRAYMTIRAMQRQADGDSARIGVVEDLIERSIIAKDEATALCRRANDRYMLASAFMDTLREGIANIADDRKMTLRKARKIAARLIDATQWTVRENDDV